MLKRFCILLVTAMAAATLSMVGQAPASAVTYVEAHAPKVSIKYSKCKTITAEASGDWDLDYSNLVDMNVYDSHGDWVGGDFWIDDADGYVSTRIKLCGNYDPKGWYHVEVDVTGYDESFEETVASDTRRFYVKITPKAKSKIVTERWYQPRKAYKWVVGGKLLREKSRYKGKRVELQARIGGYWFGIDTDRTNRKGIVGWEFKPNRFRWRFRFDGDRRTKASSSKVFRTPGVRGRPLSNAKGVTTVTPESLAQLVQTG